MCFYTVFLSLLYLPPPSNRAFKNAFPVSLEFVPELEPTHTSRHLVSEHSPNVVNINLLLKQQNHQNHQNHQYNQYNQYNQHLQKQPRLPLNPFFQPISNGHLAPIPSSSRHLQHIQQDDASLYFSHLLQPLFFTPTNGPFFPSSSSFHP